MNANFFGIQLAKVWLGLKKTLFFISGVSTLISLISSLTRTLQASTSTSVSTLASSAAASTRRKASLRRSFPSQVYPLFFFFLVLTPCVRSSPLFSPSASASASTEATFDASQMPTNVENVNHAKPKWINPCGINAATLQRLTQNFGGHYDVTPLTDGELLENVVLAAKNALKHSRFFKEDYVSTSLSLLRLSFRVLPSMELFWIRKGAFVGKNPKILLATQQKVLPPPPPPPLPPPLLKCLWTFWAQKAKNRKKQVTVAEVKVIYSFGPNIFTLGSENCNSLDPEQQGHGPSRFRDDLRQQGDVAGSQAAAPGRAWSSCGSVGFESLTEPTKIYLEP